MELDLFDTFTSTPAAGAASSSSSHATTSTLLPEVQVSLKKRPLDKAGEEDHDEADIKVSLLHPLLSSVLRLIPSSLMLSLRLDASLTHQYPYLPQRSNDHQPRYTSSNWILFNKKQSITSTTTSLS